MSSFKENNETDMAAHGICFDFYYRPKQSQLGQNGSVAAVDTPFPATKLWKASNDVYNHERLLILEDLLNEWVANDVASDTHDITT